MEAAQPPSLQCRQMQLATDCDVMLRHMSTDLPRPIVPSTYLRLVFST